MNKLTALSLACLVLSSGCGYRQLEEATVENRTGVLENSQRISQLAQRVDSLDRRLTTLSETTYEVRTRRGGKTSMVAVPVYNPTPSELRNPGGEPAAPAAAPAAPAAQQAKAKQEAAEREEVSK